MIDFCIFLDGANFQKGQEDFARYRYTHKLTEKTYNYHYSDRIDTTLGSAFDLYKPPTGIPAAAAPALFAASGIVGRLNEIDNLEK